MNLLKHIVLLGLCLALTNIAVSQSFYETPNDTVELTGMKEDLQSLMISQLNTSADTIRVKWQKVSEAVPSNWDATICDNSICYASLVDSGRMIPTAPGATSFLLLHVTAHVNFGAAIVRYAVWDETTPAQRDTLTFIVHITSTAGITGANDASGIRIYPNPVTNILQIRSDLGTDITFRVADLSGKDVQKGSMISSVSVSTDGLPSGCYFVTFLDRSKILSTHKIIKE